MLTLLNFGLDYPIKNHNGIAVTLWHIPLESWIQAEYSNGKLTFTQTCSETLVRYSSFSEIPVKIPVMHCSVLKLIGM